MDNGKWKIAVSQGEEHNRASYAAATGLAQRACHLLCGEAVSKNRTTYGTVTVCREADTRQLYLMLRTAYTVQVAV